MKNPGRAGPGFFGADRRTVSLGTMPFAVGARLLRPILRTRSGLSTGKGWSPPPSHKGWAPWSRCAGPLPGGHRSMSPGGCWVRSRFRRSVDPQHPPPNL